MIRPDPSVCLSPKKRHIRETKGSSAAIRARAYSKHRQQLLFLPQLTSRHFNHRQSQRNPQASTHHAYPRVNPTIKQSKHPSHPTLTAQLRHLNNHLRKQLKHQLLLQIIRIQLPHELPNRISRRSESGQLATEKTLRILATLESVDEAATEKLRIVFEPIAQQKHDVEAQVVDLEALGEGVEFGEGEGVEWVGGFFVVFWLVRACDELIGEVAVVVGELLSEVGYLLSGGGMGLGLFPGFGGRDLRRCWGEAVVVLLDFLAGRRDVAGI